MSGCLERFLYVAVLATPSKTLLTISYSLKIKVTSVAFWFKMKCASQNDVRKLAHTGDVGFYGVTATILPAKSTKSAVPPTCCTRSAEAKVEHRPANRQQRNAQCLGEPVGSLLLGAHV